MPRPPSPSPLRSIPAFARLSDADHAAFLAGAREMRAVHGRQIMAKGEPSDSIAILIAGRLRVSAVSAEGRAVTFRLVDPVDMVGEIGALDGGVRSADVEAIGPSRLLLIPAEGVKAALRARPDLSMAVIDFLCTRLRDTSAGLERVAMQRLAARLAHLLLWLIQKFGRPHAHGGIVIPLRLSQAEMGTMVVATREAVNKQFKLWRDEGLVGGVGGHLLLPNPAALAALVE